MDCKDSEKGQNHIWEKFRLLRLRAGQGPVNWSLRVSYVMQSRVAFKDSESWLPVA